MLHKARRLTSVQVREVLKKGRSRRAIHLSMKFLSTPTPLKTSVIVPKSVAKGAVERNRLRRAAYHALAPITGRGSAIVFVQKKPQERAQAAFAADLRELFS